MKTIFRALDSVNKRRIFWAAFRVYLSFHLINQITGYFFLRDVLFTERSFIPLLTQGYTKFLQENIGFFLPVYAALVLAMAFGIGRRFTVIAVFLATKTLQSMNGYILNGGHNFMGFLLLYLCFANSFDYFVLHKSQKRNEIAANLSNYFTNLATCSVIIHLCLIYFISGLAKAHSEVWYNGNAMYYIWNIERFQGLRLNSILAQNGALVTFVTYSVMLWELYFPALVWLPKVRVPFLLLGVGMHVGIWLSMMIYDFEVLFVITYGVFFQDAAYLRLAGRCAAVVAAIRGTRLARWASAPLLKSRSG